MIISVTGKSGSGKSLIAKKLSKKLSMQYVDIDKIGHSIYQDETLCKQLVELFGIAIIGEDGKIDRKRISKIIFSHPNSSLRQKFNELTWAPMKKQIDEKIAQGNVVLDWINLPLVEYWDKSDVKILIDADKTKRFEVLTNRDKLTEEGLLLRENGSPNYNNFKPADYVYHNKYEIAYTMSFVNYLVKKLQPKLDKDMAM